MTRPQPWEARSRCFDMRGDLAFVAGLLGVATSLLWLAATPYPMM